MNKIITLLLFLSSLTLQAKNCKQVVGVSFGDTYDRALAVLTTAFGEPEKADSAQIVFAGKQFSGTQYDRLVFSFSSERGQTVFTQARFYCYQSSKQQARTRIKQIASLLEEDYDLSYDSEDGNAFYTGGRHPNGLGKLFTLFVSPMQGRWSVQMRFGPFNYVNG